MSKARGLADLGNAYSDGALSNRNILINGNLTVNQRGLSIASVATGAYGEDRWKKTAGGMTQIIEEVNYLPSTVYTLSGTGVTTQQITSPASGDWTLPDIAVTARLIQLEVGDTATPFEHRSYGDELQRCQRYFQKTHQGDVGSPSGSIFASSGVQGQTTTGMVNGFYVYPVQMRASPTTSYYDFNGTASKVTRYDPNSANNHNQTGGPTAIQPHMLLLNSTSGAAASQVAAHMELDAEL